MGHTHNMRHAFRFCTRAALFGLISAMAFIPLASAMAASHATILMYHRFGEDKYPSTSVRIDQFEEHLDMLAEGDFNVAPLDEVIKSLQEGREIPDRTVVITIDDAYLSVFEEAYPRLKQRGFTATLFVATDPIDKRYGGYMTWDQIRMMQQDGFVIGSQTKTHPHMHRLSVAENLAELRQSNERFIDELGLRPELFAYPYGEYSLEVIDAVKQSGFTAAFGQHSGIASGYDGYYELPRFPINENYAGRSRMELAINGLPLTVSDITPKDVLIQQNPPDYGFTLSPDLVSQRSLQCFSSNYGSLDLEVLGNRVEVRIPGPLSGTRPRVNCTMLGPEGRWRWFGRQFLPQ